MLTLLRRSIFSLPAPARHLATALVAGFLLFICAASPAQAAQLSVTVVLSENTGAYREFSDALRESLLKRNITPVIVEDPARPVPNSGLVIGVGMKAATAVAASSAPAVLNVLVPKSGHEKLLRDFPRRASSRNYSAIFLDQPIGRQVALIKAALPDKQYVGVLYSAPPVELAQLRREMAEHRLGLYEQMISRELSLHDALQELLKTSEVLLALPDAGIYNSSTIRNILLATYRGGIPVIGFSSAFVKAGALCAVFSTPVQLAAQADILINKFSEAQTLPHAQYPQEFEVAVNEQVARSLGLRIKSAAELHDETKAFERNKP